MSFPPYMKHWTLSRPTIVHISSYATKSFFAFAEGTCQPKYREHDWGKKWSRVWGLHQKVPAKLSHTTSCIPPVRQYYTSVNFVPGGSNLNVTWQDMKMSSTKKQSSSTSVMSVRRSSDRNYKCWRIRGSSIAHWSSGKKWSRVWGLHQKVPAKLSHTTSCIPPVRQYYTSVNFVPGGSNLNVTWQDMKMSSTKKQSSSTSVMSVRRSSDRNYKCWRIRGSSIAHWSSGVQLVMDNSPMYTILRNTRKYVWPSRKKNTSAISAERSSHPADTWGPCEVHSHAIFRMHMWLLWRWLRLQVLAEKTLQTQTRVINSETMDRVLGVVFFMQVK